MEKEKSSKFGIGILVGVLITLVIAMGAFIIYDKVLSNNNENTPVEDTNNDKQDEEKDDEEEDNINNVKSSYEILSVDFDDLEQKKLLVNGKDTGIIGLSIYDVHYLAEVDSYLLTVSGFDVEIIYVVDKDANVVKKFIGNSYEVDEENTTKVLGGVIRNSYKFDNNTGGFYITSDNLSQDPTYVACSKQDNDVVQYTEWFKYLGNGNFSTETNVTSVTAKEYINNHNIKCN